LIAQWIHGFIAQHGAFKSQLVDLAEMHLPLFNEPVHPMRREYIHEHTKNWSRSVNSADAFVIVTPEYNYGPPPSLLNAFDYLYWEWNYKPVGFVSYGGVSAGMRGSARAAMTVSTLKMMAIPETVALPNVFSQIRDGAFEASDLNNTGATAMLHEMIKWEVALRDLRQRQRQSLSQ
jgi:NAD(P)H-dependent FMN reductase